MNFPTKKDKKDDLNITTFFLKLQELFKKKKYLFYSITKIDVLKYA